MDTPVQGALLAIVALLRGVQNGIPAHFVLAEATAPVSSLWLALPEVELRTDAGVRGAILSRITLALTAIVTLLG